MLRLERTYPGVCATNVLVPLTRRGGVGVAGSSDGVAGFFLALRVWGFLASRGRCKGMLDGSVAGYAGDRFHAHGHAVEARNAIAGEIQAGGLLAGFPAAVGQIVHARAV
jgi:hypothetical protein